MADQFLLLGGVVRTERGVRSLRRGDEIPDDALDGEEDRLRRIGAYGEPPAPEVEPSGLADASDEELEAFVASSSAKEVVEAAGDDIALAERLLAAEQEGKDRVTAVEGLEKVIDGE